MTQSNAWEVLWSPSSPSKFIKYNTSDVSSYIQLYHLYHKQEDPQAAPGNKEDLQAAAVNKSQVNSFHDGIYVCQSGVCSDFSSIKSIAWCPRKDLEDYCILAVGTLNGVVSLRSIGLQSPTNSELLNNEEFTPKLERCCHEVSWNTQEPNLLAVGLDKVRGDNSLLVWDIESKRSGLSTNNTTFNSDAGAGRKAIFVHGMGENVLSVCWLPHFNRTLVAGVSKWLRLIDMRASNPKVLSSTYALFGICVDPFDTNRICSFAGEQSHKQMDQGAVLVWDIRQSEKPLVTLNQTKPVSKVLWCPTRNHLVSVLQKDSKAVKCYDLQYISSANTFQYSNNIDGVNNESITCERNVQLPKTSKSNMSSFSWHPSVDNTILGVGAAGKLHYLTIHERIVMSWSPSLDLVWGCGKQMMMHRRQPTSMEDEDISFLMKERAKKGYGITAVMKDEKKLGEVVQDTTLVKRWSWLRHAKKVKDQSTERKNRKFLGVKAIILGELNSGKVHVDKTKVAENMKDNQRSIPNGQKSALHVPKSLANGQKSVPNGQSKEEWKFSKPYSSEGRKLALTLCSWDFASNDGLENKLLKLCLDGEAERGAAMALFHNKLSLAISILSENVNPAQHDSEPSLPIVAMALSGYSENKGALWSKNCKTLSAKLNNPYLRAIFSFLTTDDESFTNVLCEEGMLLEDRIAFACTYLSDLNLSEYIEEVTESMVESGGLEGLLLTGLTHDGMQLLENYITKTSDVQTAVLIILTTKVTEVFKDPRVNNWIESYRDLLDNWRLWNERAQFDAIVNHADPSRKIPPQISVACTYCSKPVSANLMASSGGIRAFQRHPQGYGNSRINKAMSCPSCHQPLPKCSVCLIGMGSLSSHLPRSSIKSKSLDTVVNSFPNWFTWCQMCRHGGHAVHLMEWFSEHVECPIIGCSCGCNAQDSVAMVATQQIPSEANEKD